MVTVIHPAIAIYSAVLFTVVFLNFLLATVVDPGVFPKSKLLFVSFIVSIVYLLLKIKSHLLNYMYLINVLRNFNLCIHVLVHVHRLWDQRSCPVAAVMSQIALQYKIAGAKTRCCAVNFVHDVMRAIDKVWCSQIQ